MNNLVVLGATSAIAEQVARLYAKPDQHILLVARNQDGLNVISKDLFVRGAGKVDTLTYDFSNLDGIQSLVDSIAGKMDKIDILFVAYGTLPNQQACEKDVEQVQSEINLNFVSIVSVITGLSPLMVQKGAGTIAVITSVAGDRGRKSNYINGTVKGALTVYLQGLRNSLFAKGVHVLTIKPGFVDTPMTVDFKKGLLWAKPEKIAKDIVNAITRKKDVIYTPWFWRWIMLIIKLIPERIFKKMNL